MFNAMPMPGAPRRISIDGTTYDATATAPGYPVQIKPEHADAVRAQGWGVTVPEQWITSAPNPALAPPNHVPLQFPRLKTRLIPMPGVVVRKMAVEGREYEVPQGQNYLDVPMEDARVLVFNGWLDLGWVGVTNERPPNPLRGETFTDVEIGVVLFFDGQKWRDFLSGESF